MNHPNYRGWQNSCSLFVPANPLANYGIAEQVTSYRIVRGYAELAERTAHIRGQRWHVLGQWDDRPYALKHEIQRPL